jgi:hypothetical protein
MLLHFKKYFVFSHMKYIYIYIYIYIYVYYVCVCNTCYLKHKYVHREMLFVNSPCNVLPDDGL